MTKWEIDLEADLSADLRAGNVAAAQECEGKGNTAVELVPATRKTLELIFAQAVLIRMRAIGFCAQANARAEVVH